MRFASAENGTVNLSAKESTRTTCHGGKKSACTE